MERYRAKSSREYAYRSIQQYIKALGKRRRYESDVPELSDDMEKQHLQNLKGGDTSCIRDTAALLDSVACTVVGC